MGDDYRRVSDELLHQRIRLRDLDFRSALFELQRSVFASISRGRMAEGVGFEPTVSFPTSDFESGTFDHSATLPVANISMDSLNTCFRLSKARLRCFSAALFKRFMR